MAIDPQPFFSLMTRLCCVGILIQCGEVLWNWRELPAGRLLGWAPRSKGEHGHKSVLVLFHAYPTCLWLLAGRAVLAVIGLGFDYQEHAAFWLLGALVVFQLYYNRRFTIIAGNCETLFLICLVAALAGTFPGASPLLKCASLVFVSFHVVVAYAVAGVNKLRSRSWRDGSRLLQLVRDSSYPFPSFAASMAGKARLAQALSWAVVGLELLFPIAVFLPDPVMAVVIVGGFFFHFSIAMTMGLHGFLWSFAASYPAVWFVHCILQR